MSSRKFDAGENENWDGKCSPEEVARRCQAMVARSQEEEGTGERDRQLDYEIEHEEKEDAPTFEMTEKGLLSRSEVLCDYPRKAPSVWSGGPADQPEAVTPRVTVVIPNWEALVAAAQELFFERYNPRPVSCS